jgi:hypothetical protein
MSATQEQNDGVVPEIQNRAQRPPGVSPKNKQTMLMSDKPNARYYGRHTVENAVREFEKRGIGMRR